MSRKFEKSGLLRVEEGRPITHRFISKVITDDLKIVIEKGTIKN